MSPPDPVTPADPILVERPAAQPYHLLHRYGRTGTWRPVAGVLAAVLLTFVVGPILVQVPILAFLGVTGQDASVVFDRLRDLKHPTPGGLAYLNVVLAMAIPVTFVVTRCLHGLRPGWLTSVAPRMRWRFFGTCLGLAVIALLVTVLVGSLTPQQAGGVETSGGLHPWTPTIRDFALVILLLTPFQAAGEEYLFRGYLTQAFGGMFGRRWVAVVVPAVLFALAHGIGQSLPVFFDRLAFGLVAGVLVVVTGGLEAGIAMHVLNNWLAFGLALAFGDMGSTLNATGGSWWMIPSTVAQSGVYLVLVLVAARRAGLRSTGGPSVLARPRAPV